MRSAKRTGADIYRANLPIERSKLQIILDGFNLELVSSEAGHLGARNRAIAEGRIGRLVSRIAYIDEKIAWLTG